jgi:hypothetical protein
MMHKNQVLAAGSVLAVTWAIVVFVAAFNENRFSICYTLIHNSFFEKTMMPFVAKLQAD